MAEGSKDAFMHLAAIAEAQQGYFTAKQAREAGFAEENHPYHVQAGNWTREQRGIYRLAFFPRSNEESYVLWSLWSRDRSGMPQGVYSHQTALGIHDLTELMPEKLHMTVPRRFRRTCEIPPILVIHRADLDPGVAEQRQGYRVTRPLRTLIDVLAAGEVPEAVVKQAIRQGLQRGQLTQRELESARIPPDLAARWTEIREEVSSGRT